MSYRQCLGEELELETWVPGNARACVGVRETTRKMPGVKSEKGLGHSYTERVVDKGMKDSGKEASDKWGKSVEPCLRNRVSYLIYAFNLM